MNNSVCPDEGQLQELNTYYCGVRPTDDSLTVRLCTNSIYLTNNRLITIADFVECNHIGYTPIPIPIGPLWTVSSVGGVPQVQGPECSFVIAPEINVSGYFLTDVVGKVIAAEMLPSPFKPIVGGNFYVVPVIRRSQPGWVIT